MTPIRIGTREIQLAVWQATQVKDLLAKEGFSETQGARPLRRAIEKLLTVPLSLRILLANIPQNGEVRVHATNGKLEIEIPEMPIPIVDEEAEQTIDPLETIDEATTQIDAEVTSN